jgi:hypothetical protein
MEQLLRALASIRLTWLAEPYEEPVQWVEQTADGSELGKNVQLALSRERQGVPSPDLWVYILWACAPSYWKRGWWPVCTSNFNNINEKDILNTHRSKQQQTLDHTVDWVPLSFDIMQQLQVRKLHDFIIMRLEPATLVSGFDYILECLLPLIWQIYNADNFVGAFDRIALQAYVQGPCVFVQYAELFFIKCKLGNISFLSNWMAIVVVVVVVVIIIVVIVVIVVDVIVVVIIVVIIIVTFNVGINHINFSFRFENFEKFLRDTHRWCYDVRWTNVNDMWVTMNAVVEMIKLDVLVLLL